MRLVFRYPAFLFFLLITVACFPQTVPVHSDCNLVVGMRYAYSSDYSAQMQEILRSKGGDISGSGAFLGFDAGIEFRVYSSLYVQPHFLWQFSPVTMKNNSTGETTSEMNSFLLPGVDARYYFQFSESRFFYLGAGLSSASFYTNYAFGVEPKGTSSSVMMGFLLAFKQSILGVELGYLGIPMQAKSLQDQLSYRSSPVADSDLGGVYISLTARFGLLNYLHSPENQ